jgi:hypothetical protein
MRNWDLSGISSLIYANGLRRSRRLLEVIEEWRRIGTNQDVSTPLRVQTALQLDSRLTFSKRCRRFVEECAWWLEEENRPEKKTWNKCYTM